MLKDKEEDEDEISDPPACRALQEFQRVLAQGGRLIITGDNLQPRNMVHFTIIASLEFAIQRPHSLKPEHGCRGSWIPRTVLPAWSSIRC